MATYPDIPTSTKKIQPSNPIRSAVTQGGEVLAQDLGQTPRYNIDLEHPLLTEAHISTLRAFFTTNKGTVITTQTLSDGSTYDCLLLNEPELIKQSGIFNTMRISLNGVRN